MPVDIALSVNRTLTVPLIVTINSIVQNTVLPSPAVNSGEPSSERVEPLRFNIVVPMDEGAFFEGELNKAFADYTAEQIIFRVQEFSPPEYLKNYLDTKFKEKRPERRNSRYMQYSRLLLKQIFPDVDRIVYFDADIVVLGDVRSLYALGDKLTPESYLGAVPAFFPAIFYFSNPFKVWSELRRFKSTFNSGVLLMELAYWTQQTDELVKHYLNLDAKNNYRLYHLGDETVFNITFKDFYTQLPAQWNCCGYGNTPWVTKLLRRDPKKMSAIHWSGGHQKPWKSDRVIYSDLWRRYLPASVQI